MLHTFCSSLNAHIIILIREGEWHEIRMGENKIFLQNCRCVESYERDNFIYLGIGVDNIKSECYILRLT
jgi:hypothetical protein